MFKIHQTGVRKIPQMGDVSAHHHIYCWPCRPDRAASTVDRDRRRRVTGSAHLGRSIPDLEVLRNTKGNASRMDPAPMPERIAPSDPFAVVLRAEDATGPVVLQSALDANGATVAFHTERQRLKQQHVVGELLVMRQGASARTLLREPLHQPPRTGS